MFPHRPITGLADIEALEEVPLAERLEGVQSTLAVIERAARRFPSRPALVLLPAGRPNDAPVSIDYRQLLAGVYQTANLLADLAPDGPRVSYLLPNLIETHYLIWGGEAAGVVGAVNPLLEPGQIADIITAAGSNLLAAAGPEVSPQIWQKGCQVRKLVPGLKAILQVGGEGDPQDGVFSFQELLAKYSGEGLAAPRDIDPDTLASYFHTGGTTGAPKLAQHTHGMEVFDAWAVMAMLDLGPDDTMLCGLPLFHVNAVIVTGLGAFWAGSRVVLVAPEGYRNPNVIPGFWRLVERYGAKYFVGVPTIFTSLLQVDPAGADITSLRYAVCGAAALALEVFREFERRTGLAILEGYGLTEATCVSSLNPRDGERRVGSVGIRLPYQEMKAVKLDQEGRYQRDCRPNEIGSIVVKGPNVFPGYKMEKDNRGIWAAPGWLNTGDLGRQDGAGYFWLTGRAKELIIRGGHNIDPAVIEEALYQHPEVEMAAAVPKPDPYAGELPVAFVKLTPGAKAGVADLMEHARSSISERAAIPKDIFIIPEIPLTAVGKIFKPRLRWEAARLTLAAALKPLAERGAEVDVAVGPHEVHGTLATVTLKVGPGVDSAALEKEAAKILGAYAIAYEIAEAR